LLFCSFSVGHCIVCYFVLFLLAIVLFATEKEQNNKQYNGQQKERQKDKQYNGQ
jgi:hypothetical protein